MIESLEFIASCFAVKDIAEFGSAGLQVIPVQNVMRVGQRSLLPLTQLCGAIGENFHVGLIGTEVLQHYAHTLLEMRIYRLHKCKATLISIATLYGPTRDHFKGLFLTRVAVPEISAIQAGGSRL